ncbi:hypothetical protein CLAFUW4_13892 [Fulvia fulva]|uniref:uncharacterized protein n=1 Tax=Passalora fulva TaxID=5499 RepID=UPI002852C199|nr:uncharacterized protein CLAFUR5_20363 [Fulvia fulva]KAK4610397.1 hypothetical protein CLAFUR4_13895 [Fulvia fulva]KAK4611423.1 hypothetical protein CLAFUR0_13899 [Fulvia fulva]WMI39072.1 hypothetical protein CLAFUR5_20363 [Fulvia fulva]WPV22368.1 hypothetical protein CLAFUW4_13892 [Fulvia fulva]WPV36772.1 hypothetical protein CLAFUW7_13900 [Fulvia fulva]
MDNSRLGKLPAELRNKISMFAVSQDKPIKLIHDSRGICHAPRDAREKHPLGISKTCKALYDETRGIFYAHNTFTIDPRAPGDCRQFLVAFHGSQASARRNLEKQPHVVITLPMNECIPLPPTAPAPASNTQLMYDLVRAMYAQWIFETYDKIRASGIDKSLWDMAYKFEDTESEGFPHAVISDDNQESVFEVMALLKEQGERLSAEK